ncbi:MAG: hypothetical protein ACTSR8_15800 [Promethearchaeota archaeon]
MTRVILIGLPNAGKTTLRKIFFEGNPPKDFLLHPIAPTRGVESIVINLDKIPFITIGTTNVKEFGVFDYSGQENEYWLEEESKGVFKNAKAIFLIIDVESPKTQIQLLIKKIIELRNIYTPSASINTLIHKIDLVSKDKLLELGVFLDNQFSQINELQIDFTSIKEPFYYRTATLFASLIKKLINKSALMKDSKIESVIPKIDNPDEIINYFIDIDKIENNLDNHIRVIKKRLLDWKSDLLNARIQNDTEKFEKTIKKLEDAKSILKIFRN